jgi:hypothetical protein
VEICLGIFSFVWKRRRQPPIILVSKATLSPRKHPPPPASLTERERKRWLLLSRVPLISPPQPSPKPFLSNPTSSPLSTSPPQDTSHPFLPHHHQSQTTLTLQLGLQTGPRTRGSPRRPDSYLTTRTRMSSGPSSRPWSPSRPSCSPARPASLRSGWPRPPWARPFCFREGTAPRASRSSMGITFGTLSGSCCKWVSPSPMAPKSQSSRSSQFFFSLSLFLFCGKIGALSAVLVNWVFFLMICVPVCCFKILEIDDVFLLDFLCHADCFCGFWGIGFSFL